MSAPVDPLHSATDALNEAIRDVEAALASLNLGVSADIIFTPETATEQEVRLGFLKHGDEWGLFVFAAGSHQRRRLTSCSRADRCTATLCFDELLTALRQTHATQQQWVTDAVANAHAFLARLRRR